MSDKARTPEVGGEDPNRGRPTTADAPEGTASLFADARVSRELLRDPYFAMPKDVTSSVAMLLRPEFEVVPFRGREAELEALDQWCAGPAGLAVGVILGPSGIGKTRLAAEVCRRRRAAGSTAGFLAPAASVEGVVASIGDAPLLAVVDTAERRTDQLGVLLRTLAARAHAVPIRFLLTADETGDWWTARMPVLVADAPAAGRLLSSAETFELEALGDRDGRREAFDDAARAFARAVGRPHPKSDPIDLTDPEFAVVLFVHLAAVRATIEDEPEPAAGADVRGDLIAFALSQEARYWTNTAAEWQLPFEASTLRQAVAVTTLTPADTEGDAVRMLASVPDLAVAPARVRAVTRWLQALYPAFRIEPSPSLGPGSWLEPLSPDLLGESLVVDVLKDVPTLATRVLDRASTSQMRRALSVLARAARLHPAAADSLRDALSTRLDKVWQAALSVALEEGEPLGRFLAQAVEEKAPYRFAEDVALAITSGPSALHELAVTATHHALERLRDERGAEVPARIARLEIMLAPHLSALGRADEALAATEEAVRRFEAIADAGYDLVLPELARALTYQTMQLAEAGRPEAAVLAGADAIALYRRLWTDEPDAYGFALAGTLVNHAIQLSQLGRAEESVATGEDAVSIFRALAEADPDGFLPELAGALNNQSNNLSDVHRTAEALAASEEAVALYRGLVDPEADSYSAELAAALYNQAGRLLEFGEVDAAIVVLDESITIRRKLAEAGPQRRADLALALHVMSNALVRLDRYEEALTCMEEEIEIREGLDANYSPIDQLASVLNTESLLLGRLGRDTEALVANERAIAIQQRLVALDRWAYLPNLATALSNRSVRLGQVGRPEEALATGERAVGLRRELAASDPDEFLPDLAHSLNNQIQLLAEAGRGEEAFIAGREAVAIYRELANERPEQFRSDLAAGLRLTSMSLAALVRVDEAAAYAEEAVAIYRALADGGDITVADGLADALSTYAELLSRLGRSEEALERGEEAAVIYRFLVKMDSDTFASRLASALQSQSTRLNDLGRHSEAIEAGEQLAEVYQEIERGEDALAVYEELIARFADAVEGDPMLRDHVALAFLGKAHALAGLDREVEAIAACDELIARCGQAQELAVRLSVASALLLKGIKLSELNRPEEEVAAYEELIARYVDAPEAPLRPLVARALMYEAMTLGTLGRRQEALSVYDELIRRFAGAPEPALRKEVVDALAWKAEELAQLDRHDEELATYQELVRLFGEAPEPEIQETVVEAREQLAQRGR
jgi:tetratricopeptide (TPR) repeat protein